MKIKINLKFLISIVIVLYSSIALAEEVKSNKDQSHSHKNLKSEHVKLHLIADAKHSSSGFIENNDIDDSNGTFVNGHDRLEKYNRRIYKINKFFDRTAFEPVAKVYNKSVPDMGKKIIRNILGNISEPVTILNSLFQGDGRNAIRSSGRFLINSTFGFFGAFDVAGDSSLKIKADRRDFSSTIAIRGGRRGDYFVLPIFGPATARDFIGRVVDLGIDPFNYEVHGGIVISKNAIDLTDKRASLLNLTNQTSSLSVDEYSMVRSLYLQNSEFKIKSLKERIKKNAEKNS